MALEIKKVEYFDITIGQAAGEAYKLLSTFADAGVSLLAFRASPAESGQMRFSLFPDDASKMKDEASGAGLNPDGPKPALMIKSTSDEPGECADIFSRLSRAGIDVYESGGIADIKDSFGVILYLKKEDCEKAITALAS
jgi:hypothetical protein